MPYSAISDLPKGTSKLPKHAKEIYLAAFNNAHEEYDEESTAHAVAWAAVKKKYKKNKDGKWVARGGNSKKSSMDKVKSVVQLYLSRLN